MRVAIVFIMWVLLPASASSETTITINGRTIQASGSNITVYNNTIIVDGKVLSGNILEGSGKIVSENRSLCEFETLRLDMSADVTVVKGEKSKSVITADDNILPVILTKCTDMVLQISAKESYSSQQKVMIAIETPQLKKVEINGSGKIAVMGVLKDRADLVINGSGDITAIGQVKELIATINGSGGLRAADLETKTTMVIINGSGDADLHTTDSLTAELNGSGDVTYMGMPFKVHTSVKGSGNISKK